jgi:hypothetical protein
MAEKGIAIRALESRPELSPLETIYYGIYADCGGNADVLPSLSSHYGLEGSELFDAIRVIRAINLRVQKHANNRSRSRQQGGNKRSPAVRKQRRPRRPRHR